ncbi:hemerythrin domain-containing protein [Jiella endophytica]|uniref:Hemerythrin domain-containing protein n=1 Tax=Jiella endophytica TaxID=2558362 RepID=A0A4Y8RSP0_9HYPH|nr:hemerythrin domain-containing protein [Jiella endophytica]TFF26958.1 hemerythrin domain-containing protein [Jiella endophytica]
MDDKGEHVVVMLPLPVAVERGASAAVERAERLGAALGRIKAVMQPAVLAELRRELAVQRRLCDSLEAIADALPDNLDHQHTLHVARSIGSIVRRAHAFEETTIFPLLDRSFRNRPQLAATLERLHFEHWEDESFAEELAEKLIDYVKAAAARPGPLAPRCAASVPRVGVFGTIVSGPLSISADPVAEALGYMLRGFFEGLRRHIAFEEEHLLPLLGEIG